MEIVRYPDSRLEVLDERFARYKLANAALEMLWTGGRWLEGPVWFGDGRYLLFSDIPNNRILKWEEETGEVSVFRKPSNNTNGNTRDLQGRLLSCEHDARRVTRTEYDGSITVLMDRFEGKPLNAPNDIVAKSDGSIWFTDPGYGILMDYEGHRDEFENAANVYRLDPDTEEATVVAGDFQRPNGLCFVRTSRCSTSSIPGAPTGLNTPLTSASSTSTAAALRTGACSRTWNLAPRTGSAPMRMATCGRGPVGGGRGLRRRALFRPRRHLDRQDPPAGALRQPLLWRREKEPAVHNLFAVAVLGVRRDERGSDTL